MGKKEKVLHLFSSVSLLFSFCFFFFSSSLLLLFFICVRVLSI